jgi:hypothetical protein
MPQQTPLRTGDPKRVGRYSLVGRIAGIPADDPVFVGISPDGAHVAISMLRTDWAKDAAGRDRFAAEAAVAKRVPPFCAARVLDAGLEGFEAYLVSEYVPGPSLLEVVVGDGVRAGPDLEAVAIGMATGLAAVHQAGLVHGNFGPEYVIMANDGVPRVVEFGITPPYGTATPGGDMLAWAQTVVFAATGRPPAGHAEVAVLPDPLIEVAVRCLDPDPAARPPARSVVLSLLGDVELPAGVLAEGMRRASRSGPYAAARHRPHARPRHSAAGPRTARQAPPRPEQPEPGRPGPAQPGPGRPAQPGPGRPRSAQPGPGHAGSAQAGPARAGPAPMAAARPGPSPLPSGQAQTARPGFPRQGTTRPATADTGQRHHAPAHEPRVRRAWLLATAAVILVVVIVATVFRLLQGGSSPGRAATSGDSKSRSPAASTSPSGKRSPSATIPSAFAGTWLGVVRQPPTDTYHVSVGLKAGSAQGTVRYSSISFACSGILSLRRAGAAKLTMGQIITTGSCENGNVTISVTGAGTVWFSFRSAGPIASGKLTRS